MMGYKAFNFGMTCRGFKYEIGKTYKIEGKLEMCKNGFHFCKNIVDTVAYGYQLGDDNIYCKVEAIGTVHKMGTKYCTDEIKIIEVVPWSEIERILDNKINSGFRNSGLYNSGNHNSGNHNSGNYNSGYYNSGHYNSGSYNSGDYNSGHYNSGSCNSGYFNSNEPTVRLFNKDSGLTYDEFFNLGIGFNRLEQSKDVIKSLPGYDPEIFLQCTGIDWRDEE